jgi:rhodanese-related sulfurtransferase
MATDVDATTLKAWLSDGSEIAVLDVREHGQYGMGHLFFAVPLPYSRFELDLRPLVPNPAVRLVLYDDGDGVAARAATRAQDLGYGNLHILAGGAPAWRLAGYTLYEGVNVPSKTFGELVEHQRHTPRVTAQELQAMRAAGDNMVIVDGRPFAEYSKMSIPDGICCPNGELALRIRELAPDPQTKIIVNCAGRTRSIIGAQLLIDFGVPNPVCALENGTQGWFLAGFALENGASRRYPDQIKSRDTPALAVRARALAQRHGVTFVSAGEAQRWLADTSRTTYLLDVRTAEEVRASGLPGLVHAPGGQLIQATDQWVGVKGARLVLVDDELVRAPVIASWLRQLGHEACVLAGGITAAGSFSWRRPGPPSLDELPMMAPRDAAQAIERGTAQAIDLRPAMAYRQGHIPQSAWSIRPRIAAAAGPAKTIVLVVDVPGIAALAAVDLGEAGYSDVRMLAGGFSAWQTAGLPITATPDLPADPDCIDFLFFTARRHDNDPAAARQYLDWETGLLARLDAQERGVFFALAPPAA